MESAPQTFRMWHGTLSCLWKRHANPSDFVWLGRFRLLSIYTILKGLLLITAGGIGASLSFLQSGSLLNRTPLLWIGMILGMTISALLLISGLVMASEDRPRSIGLVRLGASDLCVLLAVVFASILNNLFLLLIILVFISCTTPLLIERISRDAKRFLQREYELARLKNERDSLLRRFSQELVRAIEQQPLSLKREIHDGLIQELSALLLQVTTPYGSKPRASGMTPVCRPTPIVRGVAHQRALLKATDVSHGTTLEHGSIFTSGPTTENPPKRYAVENVQKNYISILFERNKSGTVDSTPLQIRNAAFIPMHE